MQWNIKLIDRMLQLEKISAEWQTKVHFLPLVPDYYLSYESLLIEEERLGYIRQVIGFLTNKNVQHIQTNANLQQLHKPVCSDQIMNYDEFRMHKKVRGSRSAAACDMIQYHFGGNGKKDGYNAGGTSSEASVQ